MIVGDGRPLRFLALVPVGWVALRLGVVWYATGSLPQAVREALPIPQPAEAASTVKMPVPESPTLRPRSTNAMDAAPGAATIIVATTAATASMSSSGNGNMASELPASASVAMARLSPVPAAVVDAEIQQARPDIAGSLIRAAAPSRLSVSSWLIARGGTGIGATPLSPQLGGTQGGVRVDYALTRGIAATARVAAPAAGAGRELSLGLAWRPAGVPLRFVAEQRLALDRGGSGPALGVSGGVSELRLPANFRLDGYGQAGAILRRGVERYVDASIRAARPIADVAGITVDLGAGAWGGAQRGVARLDVGPSVGAGLPLGDRRVRVALDWRQRIAGDARPGSGPALSLGTDF